jgi:hypothetical protein
MAQLTLCASPSHPHTSPQNIDALDYDYWKSLSLEELKEEIGLLQITDPLMSAKLHAWIQLEPHMSIVVKKQLLLNILFKYEPRQQREGLRRRDRDERVG